ncbi:DNA repair protein RadC [Terrisporobacter hibernicus]|uniref:DNA repair protein RadC n=2 Tax=Terrisporobacter hibernicus TaxID=2813371 RepID=A0AAX2ZIL7_9FIRM|nr:DNA repair protein RadC [Terrisporobacter hibernicus]
MADILKKGGIDNKMSSKRVDIVSIKMIKESSIKYENRKINNPWDGFKLLRDMLEDCDRENMVVVCLNTKNEPINISVVSVGTLNSSLVHPREIFKTAILSNSNKILIAHNHPSGKVDPSNEDNKITKRLKESGELLGIEVLDHLIIGDGLYFSYKENMKI